MPCGRKMKRKKVKRHLYRKRVKAQRHKSK